MVFVVQLGVAKLESELEYPSLKRASACKQFPVVRIAANRSGFRCDFAVGAAVTDGVDLRFDDFMATLHVLMLSCMICSPPQGRVPIYVARLTQAETDFTSG